MSENQSWREEFRKKFGRFYVSQLGTIDIEGAESIASDDVEYFIESQIAAAEARGREEVLDLVNKIRLDVTNGGTQLMKESLLGGLELAASQIESLSTTQGSSSQ